MQDTLAQQKKSCSPKPHALDELQFIHFALDDPIALRQGESCQHGSFVSFNAANKALEFFDMAIPYCSEPVVKTFPLPMTKHIHEVLDQFIHQIGRWRSLTNESEVLSLSLIQISRTAHEEPDRIFRGEILQWGFWNSLCSLSLARAGDAEYPRSDRKKR